jgi:hypothetical protein
MQGGKRRKKTEKVSYTNYSSLTRLLMDSAHILQFVDEVVCARTGKHLNDLQRGIIEGILKRQKYSDIADTYGCTAGHAKDVGYELLQMLSDIFSEPVDKRNLQSVLKRQSTIKIALNNSNNIDVIATPLTISRPAQKNPLLPQTKVSLRLLTSRKARIKLKLK